MALGCFAPLSITGACGNCGGNHKTTQTLERDLAIIQAELDRRYAEELLNRCNEDGCTNSIAKDGYCWEHYESI